MLRPKNQPLPGMEQKGHPELYELGLQYAAFRDDRMATLKKEVEIKGQIIPRCRSTA